MGRLYYRDSYGRVHRNRRAGQRIPSGYGLPARFFVTALMVLAGIIVIASLIRLPAQLPAEEQPAARRSDTCPPGR
jgi:hypothetical protein